MEIRNEVVPPSTLQRSVALGLAMSTTLFIAAGVVTLFTGSTQIVAAALVRVASAPLRVMLGG